MSMSDWAKKEVELACKNEREIGKTPEGEFSYGCAIYKSALKAFLSLMEDGHTNNSIHFTKDTLIRLLDGKPLTPLTGNENEWNLVTENENKDIIRYQNNRCYSVFKDIDKEGNIHYRDLDRFICTYENSDFYFSNGFIENIAEETVGQITMPYMPLEKRDVVLVEDFLFDETKGDFDTIKIISIISKSHGKDEEFPVNRYFKEDKMNEWVEIDKDEYENRFANKILR